MKYIDSKSILINDSIPLYNADGSQESYEPNLNIVETIHSGGRYKIKAKWKRIQLALSSYAIR